MYKTILASRVYGSVGFRCELQGRNSEKYRYRTERVVLVCGTRRWTVRERRTPFLVWVSNDPDHDELLELYQDIVYAVLPSVVVDGTTIEIQEAAV